jgi:DNA (cytosine-5)-methyltransferase 1
MSKISKFTFIDLFAGIGGFHHALHSIGGECKLAVEFDKDCQVTYRTSFPDAGIKFPLVTNIREITRHDINDEDSLRTSNEINKLVPDHNVLCGGFPCQPFSKSGEQRGISDKTRGTLFFDIVQIIEAKKPEYVFLENVRNISGPRHVDTWATIVESIRNQGYRVSDTPLIFSPHLLPTELDGAPQVRDRVFIFGIRSDIHNDQLLNIAVFNEYLRGKRYWNPDKWRIKNILLNDDDISDISAYEIKNDEKIYLDAWNWFVEEFEKDSLPGFPIWAFAWKETPAIKANMYDWEKNFLTKNSAFYCENKGFLDKFVKMKWGNDKKTILDFPFSRQILEWQARSYHSTRKGRTLNDLVVQFRPSGIRVKPPTYLPALVAITQTSVMGPKLRKGAKTFRKLTPLEASRLQSVPESVFKKLPVNEKQAYKQLGNAVNVGIVRTTAKIMLGIEHPDSLLQHDSVQKTFFE